MKRFVATAAIVWVGAAVLVAQTAPGRLKPAPAAKGAAAAKSGVSSLSRTSTGDAAHYQAWVKQYCVTCHNTRTPQPANDPVNLETASVDDLLKNAATWERVLRKLSVRAMPPV